MSGLFLLCFIFGIYLLYIGLKRQSSENLLLKFSSNQKPKKAFNLSELAIFSNIYQKDTGFNRKNLIILCAIICIFVAVNKLFLGFNLALAAIFAGFVGIYLINSFHLKLIRDDFDKNFPEVLVILNGAISAGANVPQALNDCANAVSGVLSSELKKIVKSLAIGDDANKVFEASYKRLPFKSYYFFLTALSVSLNSGARLKEVLSRLSNATSKAKAIEKKKNAMTSEARMSSKITAAIPFVFLFLMKFISPENFDFILHDERGRYILYYFLGSEALGMLIIMFLMRKI